ncbi:MAG: hypothetical protein K9N49_04535 [Candidatus Marinimicrobia bacterium]|nr:hypothetical protein [Candidatus Neomarinimicrobiota bacterium]
MSSINVSTRMQAIGRALAGPALAVSMAFPAQARDNISVVAVAPGQTLNAALADVEGPVMILLPAGVTEHDAAITRNETVIIKGQGMNITTLRPAARLGPDEGVALVAQTAGFDGDFIIEDLTYDRAHHPGETPDDPAVATGAEIFRVYARTRVEFRNVAIHHFDYGAREGQNNATRPFVFTQPRPWREAPSETETRTRDMIFRNVHIDWERGGGIRHRPGGQHGTFNLGVVDRLLIDGDCVFRSHLCQDANPEYTVGPVWRGRGNAGPMFGLTLYVAERAYIDGVWHNSDYGAWRGGGPIHPDAVIEWRMDLLNAGYGDQFWHRPSAGPNPPEEAWAHMIFKDVRLEGHRTGKLWNDYGIRARGHWKTITFDGCTSINRGHPLAVEGVSGEENQGRVVIRNCTVSPVGGGGPGVLIGDFQHYESILIDGLLVYPDLEAGVDYFNAAISINETGSGGGRVVISNVQADGYLYGTTDLTLGDATELVTHNIQGVQRTPDTLVAQARPVAVLPRQSRSFKIDGIPEPLDWAPVATIEDFEHTEPFERIDVWLAFDAGPGVFVRVIVGGVGEYRNANAYPTRLYRGDALQFFITRGRPGEVFGGTHWDIAKHDEMGLTAYRRSDWPDLPDGVVDIPMAIEYYPEQKEIVYEFMLPWEEINLPAPWYEDICVSLVVADGQAYGAHYKGAAWQHTHGPDIKHAIFHAETPRSRGANWIRFGGAADESNP